MKASAMKVRQRIADDLSGIHTQKKRNLNLTNHRFLDVKSTDSRPANHRGAYLRVLLFSEMKTVSDRGCW